MLIGILGDIHANIEALQAALEVLERLAVKKIYCAGDVVGYGGAPSECIDLIRERKIPCVCGNHDYYTVNPYSYNPDHIRTEADDVIKWNRTVLREDQIAWLDSLPFVIENEFFMLTHSSCQPYPIWQYVTTQRTAALHLLFQPTRLCFNAHSHVPLIATHKPGSSLKLEFLNKTTLPKNGNVMVGVGAVGQPRDEDPRACIILYNTNTDTVSMVRTRYDIAAAQKRIIDNGLPPFLASRLSKGQ